MPRRITQATLAILGIALAIGVSYLIFAARVREPLQFRLLSQPASVGSLKEDAGLTPYEMELRNTSFLPIVLYDVKFEPRGSAGYQGGFGYVHPSGMRSETLSEDLIVASERTLAGHETVRIEYYPVIFDPMPNMMAGKPVIRYHWKPSILDKMEVWLKKLVPEAWKEHFPLVDVTTTLVPLDVSTLQSTAPPP